MRPLLAKPRVRWPTRCSSASSTPSPSLLALNRRVPSIRFHRALGRTRVVGLPMHPRTTSAAVQGHQSTRASSRLVPNTACLGLMAFSLTAVTGASRRGLLQVGHAHLSRQVSILLGPNTICPAPLASRQMGRSLPRPWHHSRAIRGGPTSRGNKGATPCRVLATMVDVQMQLKRVCVYTCMLHCGALLGGWLRFLTEYI